LHYINSWLNNKSKKRIQYIVCEDIILLDRILYDCIIIIIIIKILLWPKKNINNTNKHIKLVAENVLTHLIVPKMDEYLYCKVTKK